MRGSLAAQRRPVNRILLLAGVIAAVASLIAYTRSRPASLTSQARGHDLRVGQEWRFRARTQDPDPRLVIDKLETLPKAGNVVHVSIRGVRVRNPHAPGGYSDTIRHMPFSRAAVESSITTLLQDSVALPGFEEGYQEWRQAQGGVFTVSVLEGLEFMEKTLN
jgi:hypothetical protein